MNPPSRSTPALYRDIVRRALAEDLGLGRRHDAGSSCPHGARATGVLVARADDRAGRPRCGRSRRSASSTPAWASRPSGATATAASPGETIATVTGLAAPLLTAERTALNLLRHLSGVASVTRWCVEAGGGTLRIADTRKTTAAAARPAEIRRARRRRHQRPRRRSTTAIVIKANHVARWAAALAADAWRARGRRSPDAPIAVEAATARGGRRGAGGRRGSHPVHRLVARGPAAGRAALRGPARVECPGRSRSIVWRHSRRPARISCRSGPSPIRRLRRTSPLSSTR